MVDTVRGALDRSGLAPGSLVLELIEDVVIKDVGAASSRLSELKVLGIRLAVDDFGTGYSSLTYLRSLPFDILKIDKSFIDGVDADDEQSKLTTAIIDLARVLGLRCVAEGVERPEQRDRLRRLNCDYAQGFLLARPMSAEALSELLGADVSRLAAT
jgi:EAL domain-containing protein (putative c-di-GMP-specific phosphodiesterase class I)